MSLNRQMHDRNPYKAAPPDFKQLAIEFEEFRKYCSLSPSGKVSINFQDDDTVRCLSRVLLKKDFNLNVDLPKGTLVPRIPQKINYVLHIDDLIKRNDLETKSEIYGIDIGTGASCIYALLAARMCDWNMLATDADLFAVQTAHQNVVTNNLTNKIRIAHVDAAQKAILLDVVKHHEDVKFTFCMCNPPFFESHETSKRFDQQESGVYSNKLLDGEEGGRPAPRSATMARSNELQVEGGELAFVNRIIDDSIILQDRILIYTSMLGKKQSVNPLKRRLERLMGVRFAVSTLNQGKTQRWVLAWTFRHDIIVDVEANPTVHSLPTTGMINPKNWIIDQLSRLNMKKSEQGETLLFDARQITWRSEKQRKDSLRRLAIDEPPTKKAKCDTADVACLAELGEGDGLDSYTDAGNVNIIEIEEETRENGNRGEEKNAKKANGNRKRTIGIQTYFPVPKDKLFLLRVAVRVTYESKSANPGHGPSNLISSDSTRIEFELVTGPPKYFHQLVQYVRTRLPKENERNGTSTNGSNGDPQHSGGGNRAKCERNDRKFRPYGYGSNWRW